MHGEIAVTAGNTQRAGYGSARSKLQCLLSESDVAGRRGIRAQSCHADLLFPIVIVTAIAISIVIGIVIDIVSLIVIVIVIDIVIVIALE